jgi:NAD(P)-dependent dehydrogenase (short-subunit alcohol dehydrogenase family)
MAPNTILVLGAGPRVGFAVARKFKAEGYQVAVGSRNPDINKAKQEGFLPISADLTDLESVTAAFVEVKGRLGTPNVVVYNGTCS